MEPQELNISHLDKWDFNFQGDYNPNFKNKPEISAARIEGMIEDFVFQCKELKRIGFDGVTFYMSYRASILANAISPVLNQRKDQWGGETLAERARLPLTVFRQVKEACGKDFLAVTPGIRFADAATDDQVRITTPERARQTGSDLIVVGRPITAAQDPVAAYERCVAEFCG